MSTPTSDRPTARPLRAAAAFGDWAEHMATVRAAMPAPDPVPGSSVSPHCAGLGLHYLCPGCACSMPGCTCRRPR